MSTYERQKKAGNLIIFKDFKSERLGEFLTFVLAKGKQLQSILMGQNEEWKYPADP